MDDFDGADLESQNLLLDILETVTTDDMDIEWTHPLVVLLSGKSIDTRWQQRIPSLTRLTLTPFTPQLVHQLLLGAGVEGVRSRTTHWLQGAVADPHPGELLEVVRHLEANGHTSRTPNGHLVLPALDALRKLADLIPADMIHKQKERLYPYFFETLHKYLLEDMHQLGVLSAMLHLHMEVQR